MEDKKRTGYDSRIFLVLPIALNYIELILALGVFLKGVRINFPLGLKKALK